jgi:hypothetical protein
MPDMPTGDITDAPLEEFIDPQSGIANILQQMQGAAQRSRPLETIENANRPMPSSRSGMSPEEFIRMLLTQR